jgi:hypothetical protein
MKKYYLLFLFLMAICLLLSDNNNTIKQLSDKFHKEKAEAIKIAQERNLVIRETYENGTTIELKNFKGNVPLYYITDNADGANLIKTSHLYPGGLASLELTGSNQTLALWDEAKILLTHQEFQNRASQGDNPQSYSAHATHVGGTMIAGGVISAAKGMSYQANLVGYDWNNDSSEMLSAANNGLKVSNHSYGYITGWNFSYSNYSWYWYGDTSISETEDYNFGFYSENAQEWDALMNAAPEYLIVKAAGNDRGDGPDGASSHYVMENGNWVLSQTMREKDGGPDGYDCISHNGVAKNVLTIGAVNNNENMSSFSGWGPTDDGRIKPDVVAKGVDVYSSVYQSSNINNSYDSYSGTSMATPMVTGSIGVLLQHQENLHNEVALKAATLKALIIHTADNHTIGPDYRYGWGLMNTEKAVSVMTDNSFENAHIKEMSLSNGQTISLEVVATGNEPLKVTIVWNDIPGNISEPALNPNDLKLINDLDMRIVDNVNIEYMPYILNPANPAVAATTGDNFRDNVEVVYIENPTPNTTYTINITHKNTLHNNFAQNFSLIVTGNISNYSHPAPNNLIASPDDDNMLLSWDPIDNNSLIGYNLFRSAFSNINTPNAWTEIALNTSQTFVIDNSWGLLENGVYKYIVQAVYSDGLSPKTYSNSVYKSDNDYSCGIYLGNADSQTLNAEIPINYNYKNGVSQSIFLEEEIGFSGDINGMVYHFTGSGVIPDNIDVSIYLAITDEDYFPTENSWIPTSEFTEVFTGTLNVNAEGSYDIFIPFDNVFEYTGGNLVFMAHRHWTNDYYNQFNQFTTTIYDDNRTLYTRSDNTMINLTNLPQGILSTEAANTVLYFIAEEYGSLNGVVTTQSNQPLSGVRITINETNFTTHSNELGEYSFDYLHTGAYHILANKPGYQSYESEDLIITQNETLNHNFEMFALDNVSVSGIVRIINSETPISNANISLIGDSEYNILTNDLGEFIINDVLTNDTYNLQISAQGFITYSETINVQANDVNIGIIYLNEYLYPPVNVTSEFIDNNIILNWNTPNNELVTLQSKNILFCNSERALLGYNVYRDQELLNSELVTELSYTDENPNPGQHFYGITAVYDGGESIQVTTMVNIPIYTQEINLTEGWNLISVNRDMQDIDMTDVFDSVILDNSLIMVQDEDYNSLLFNGQNWVNDIGNMQSEKGYWVKMAEDSQIILNESPTQLPMTINLRVGWNLISYPYDDSYQGLQLVQLAIQNQQIERILDSSGNTIELIPNLGIIDDINFFNPGEGYAVKANSELTLQFPSLSKDNIRQSIPKFVKSQTKNRTEHFQPIWSGKGWQHFNYIIVANNLLLNQISIGDEIAIFDGENCVGASVYQGPSTYLRISASLNDELDDVNGFNEGNPVIIKIWKADENIEYDDLLINVYSGDNTFTPGETTVISIDAFTSINDEISTLTTNISSIYPNPFNPETNISFNINNSGYTLLEIYNIKGQKVKTLISENLKAGNHNIVWKGDDDNSKHVASGIYFTKLVNANNQIIKKMLLIK